MVDGVWIAAEPITRETADPLLAALKVLCGMNPQDRQTRREGKFVARLDKDSYAATLVCQGVASGERAVVQFDTKQLRFDKLEALGMRPKMQEQLAELLTRKQGLLLFSAAARRRTAKHHERRAAIHRSAAARIRGPGSGEQPLRRN